MNLNWHWGNPTFHSQELLISEKKPLIVITIGNSATANFNPSLSPSLLLSPLPSPPRLRSCNCAERVGRLPPPAESRFYGNTSRAATTKIRINYYYSEYNN
ncbi:hypothetical protein ACLKA7_012760 [Drosophila subpalustris]